MGSVYTTPWGVYYYTPLECKFHKDRDFVIHDYVHSPKSVPPGHMLNPQ